MGGAGRDRKRGMENSSGGGGQREAQWSFDLLLHVEVNGKEQVLSSEFLPSLWVFSTHTHTQMWSRVPSCPLQSDSSFSRSAPQRCGSKGLRRCWSSGLLNALSIVRCDSTLRLLLVGGDLRKERERIPLHPRQPGESSQHETRAQHNSVKEKINDLMKCTVHRDEMKRKGNATLSGVVRLLNAC